MPQVNYEPKIEQVVQDYPNHIPNPNQIQVIFLKLILFLIHGMLPQLKICS